MERKTRAAIRSIGRSLSLASGASTKPYVSGAVVTTIDGGTAWVLVDGSDEPMPVTKSIDCKPGDRVQVRVTNSSAHVTGNVTAPPTDDAQAVVAQEQTQAVQTQVTKTAETVEQVVVTGTLDRINIGTGNTVPAESAAIGRRNTLGSQAGGIPFTVRSFVLGSRNTAMGTKNFIVGDVNSVAISGDLWADTYVFGDMNTVSSTGHGFVFGQYNTIGGDEITYPVCFGVENELVGHNPFALGYNLIAHSNQYVFGRANVEDASEEYAIVFGNGTVLGETDTRPETVTRSNALTVDWSGNEWVSGNVEVGGLLKLLNANIDRDGSAPSATVWGDSSIRFTDVNAEELAYLRVFETTSGTMAARLQVNNEPAGGGTAVSNHIQLSVSKNGTVGYSVGDAAAFRAALGFDTWTSVATADWFTAGSGWTVTTVISYNAALGVVKLRAQFTATTAKTAGNKTLGTVKAAYRPSIRSTVPSLSAASQALYIDAGGSILANTSAVAANGNIWYAGEYHLG